MAAAACFACSKGLVSERFHCRNCVHSIVDEFRNRIDAANERLTTYKSKLLSSNEPQMQPIPTSPSTMYRLQLERFQLYHTIRTLQKRMEQLQIRVKSKTKQVKLKRKSLLQRRQLLEQSLAAVQTRLSSPTESIGSSRSNHSVKTNSNARSSVCHKHMTSVQRLNNLRLQISSRQSTLIRELFAVYQFDVFNSKDTNDVIQTTAVRLLSYRQTGTGNILKSYQTPESRIQLNAMLMELARLIELISRYLDLDLPFNFQLKPQADYRLNLTTGYAVDSFALPLFATSRRPFIWFDLALAFLSYSVASICFRLNNIECNDWNSEDASRKNFRPLTSVFDWLAAIKRWSMGERKLLSTEGLMEFSEYLSAAGDSLGVNNLTDTTLRQSVISFFAEYGVTSNSEEPPIIQSTVSRDNPTICAAAAAAAVSDSNADVDGDDCKEAGDGEAGCSTRKIDDWNIVDEMQLLPPAPSADDKELLIWQQLSFDASKSATSSSPSRNSSLNLH